ncbi:polysaccharide deacetylase family protein [Alkalicoccobacillus gibsonii]|uniref:polysaccharide deacetylase family protein n=1 Tax=Alkalicoccobacillus gibsonii TaxID=79881 RepID=UPI003F7C4BD6
MKKKSLPIIILAVLGTLLFLSIYNAMGFQAQPAQTHDETAVAELATSQVTRSEDESGEEQTSEEFVQMTEDDHGRAEEYDHPIHLTFDDGPNAATPAILNELKKYDYKATFFMLEPQMKQYPDLVKRIVNEGHAVGLHGVTHVVDTFYGSEEVALQEMLDTQDTLYDLTGVKSTLVRTPYGSIPYFTDSFRALFDEHELKLWDWNVDSEDWKGGDYLNNVTIQIKKVEENGQIPTIVMHDKEKNADQLSDLLNYLSKHEFTPVKIYEDDEPINFKCNDRCSRRN